MTFIHYIFRAGVYLAELSVYYRGTVVVIIWWYRSCCEEQWLLGGYRGSYGDAHIVMGTLRLLSGHWSCYEGP